MFIRSIQAIVVSLAFIGWIIYQLLYKRKPFADIRNDAMAILFFIGVWFSIYYFLLS